MSPCRPRFDPPQAFCYGRNSVRPIQHSMNTPLPRGPRSHLLVVYLLGAVMFGSMVGSVAMHDEHILNLDQDCLVCKIGSQPVTTVSGPVHVGPAHAPERLACTGRPDFGARTTRLVLVSFRQFVGNVTSGAGSLWHGWRL